ncbi:hypothetical protein ACRJ4W_52085 [Streptomyces sp. GLT-R25]
MRQASISSETVSAAMSRRVVTVRSGRAGTDWNRLGPRQRKTPSSSNSAVDRVARAISVMASHWEPETLGRSNSGTVVSSSTAPLAQRPFCSHSSAVYEARSGQERSVTWRHSTATSVFRLTWNSSEGGWSADASVKV